MYPAVHPTGRTFDLGMIVVADDQDIIALGMVFFHHPVDTADQRTGGVDGLETEKTGPQFDQAGNPVGAEDADTAGGNIRQILDKNCAELLQFLENMTVVDNLVQDIYRCAIPLEAEANGFNGPLNPGAEPPRLSKDNFSGRRLFR